MVRFSLDLLFPAVMVIVPAAARADVLLPFVPVWFLAIMSSTSFLLLSGLEEPLTGFGPDDDSADFAETDADFSGVFALAALAGAGFALAEVAADFVLAAGVFVADFDAAAGFAAVLDFETAFLPVLSLIAFEAAGFLPVPAFFKGGVAAALVVFFAGETFFGAADFVVFAELAVFGAAVAADFDLTGAFACLG